MKCTIERTQKFSLRLAKQRKDISCRKQKGKSQTINDDIYLLVLLSFTLWLVYRFVSLPPAILRFPDIARRSGTVSIILLPHDYKIHSRALLNLYVVLTESTCITVTSTFLWRGSISAHFLLRLLTLSLWRKLRIFADNTEKRLSGD